ncbi:MAG: fibronectin type III domain-containing protein [Treponema sp.]|nr:fibronectin type III domain-containing protein [Treponema sp.]
MNKIKNNLLKTLMIFSAVLILTTCALEGNIETFRDNAGFGSDSESYYYNRSDNKLHLRVNSLKTNWNSGNGLKLSDFRPLGLENNKRYKLTVTGSISAPVSKLSVMFWRYDSNNARENLAVSWPVNEEIDFNSGTLNAVFYLLTKKDIDLTSGQIFIDLFNNVPVNDAAILPGAIRATISNFSLEVTEASGNVIKNMRKDILHSDYLFPGEVHTYRFYAPPGFNYDIYLIDSDHYDIASSRFTDYLANNSSETPVNARIRAKKYGETLDFIGSSNTDIKFRTDASSTSASAYVNTTSGNVDIIIEGFDVNSTGIYEVRYYRWSEGELKPDAPLGVTANATSSNSITISWYDVPNATSYIIQRRMISADGTSVTAGTATGTSFIDSSLLSDTTYYYSIVSQNDYGTSDESLLAWAKTKMPVPGIPVVSVASEASTSITISWSPIEKATKYEIFYRPINGDYGSTPLHTITGIVSNPITYTHNGLQEGYRYCYRVRACNDDYNGALSSEVEGQTTTADGSLNNPFPLIANTWANGAITQAIYDSEEHIYGSVFYSFDAVPGSLYFIWLNDEYEGNSTKTLDVLINVFLDEYSYETIIGEGDDCWDTPVQISVPRNGKVIIEVFAYDWETIESKGTFAVAYTINNAISRP